MFLIYHILFPLFLFTVIPAIPAFIISVKFSKAAPKLIAAIATVLVIFSLFTLENSAVSYLSFMLLPATAPILYCAAFLNTKKKIYIALIPPALFFIYYFVQYCVSFGFLKAIQYLIIGVPGDQSPLITFMSVIFILWALLCIGICKFFKRRKKEI